MLTSTIFALLGVGASSFAPARLARPPRAAPPSMNLFGDFFDDGKLKPQAPYERPLYPPLVKKEADLQAVLGTGSAVEPSRAEEEPACWRDPALH